MKVGELIEVLKSYPKDLEVFSWDFEDGYVPVDIVAKATAVEGISEENGEDLIDTYNISYNEITAGHQFIALKVDIRKYEDNNR